MAQNISFDVIARDRASSTFNRVGRSSETALSRLVRFGKSTAGLVGVASLTTAAIGFVKVGGEYVGSLNKIQALTGANDTVTARAAKTLESQSSTYAKMGQTVGDAAGGVVELTKAGLSLDKSMKAVNATMVLAKAGQLSVADASNLVANTLNTFHLKASQAGDIANYLANAANISSADVVDLAESLKYVAPVAASTGVSLKQTSAILAMLSNNGIKASNAGTGFRKFLLSLQAPSGVAKTDLHDLGVEIFDASGKMKPLGEVIDILGGKLDKLTDQKRQKVLKDVFGLQGISSATVILKNGSKGLDTYAKGVTKAGAAQKLAEAASKGFTGTLSALRAEVISDAQATYRELSPSLDTAAKKVLAFVQQMKSGKGAGGDFVHVLKDLATVTKGLLTFLDGLPGPIKRFGIEGLIAYGIIRKLTAATSGWGTSLTTTVAKAKQFGAEMTYSTTRTQAFKGALSSASGILRNVAGTGGMLLLADSTGRVGTKMGLVEAAAGGALSGAALGAFAGPEGAAIGGAIGGLAAGAATLFRNTKAAGNAARDALGKWEAYKDTLDAVTGATTQATRQFALQRLQQSGVLRNTEAIGIADRDVVNAVVNGGKARERVIRLLEKEKTGIAANVAAKQAELDADVAAAGNTAGMSDAQIRAAQDRADATRTELDALKDRRKAVDENADATLRELGAVDKAVKGKRRDIAAITDLTGKLKGLPKSAATKIRAEGIIPTVKGITDLAERYRLTPKQIKTVIAASGVPFTKKQIENIIKLAQTYATFNPNPHFSADTAAAAARIKALIDGIARIKDKTVHITAYTNANVAEHASGKGSGRGTGPDAPRYAGGRGGQTQTLKVSKALDKFSANLSTVSSKLSTLKDLKAQFQGTFQAANLFGADLSGGGGANALISFEAQQAEQAKQLLADIQNVTGRGLSKQLVAQLQSEGTSGAMQLRAIAQGTDSQIAQLNALTAQTTSALSAAGMLAGNTVRGGSINADIGRASREEIILERLVRRLKGMDQDIIVEIDGEAIVRAIRRRNKRKGVRSADI